MKVSIIQYDIEWENITGNLARVEKLIGPLVKQTDLVILPEMFTTGFSMNNILLAEESHGPTYSWMKEMSRKTGSALCGSYIIREEKKFYNRFMFVTPEGDEWQYDKRHLFSVGGEDQNYAAGNRRLTFRYRDFRINAIICYDLRFPVWIRNRNDYDLLICVANWPGSRREVWKTLLRARAIENQCYLAAVNRIGDDPEGNSYTGDSVVLDPRGNAMAEIQESTEGSATVEILFPELDKFRKKFPVWKEADDFTINIS